MRGQLISTIKSHRVDIFGGDLSYGRISDPLLILNQNNIHYQPSTRNYQDSSKIYQSSRINLNISSLQFDSAVNNRVIDIILSSGFVLTDKRGDFATICPYATEVSFETPEEMNEKIAYYSDASNHSRYYDLKIAIYESFKSNFTYANTIDYIFNKINSSKDNTNYPAKSAP